MFYICRRIYVYRVFNSTSVIELIPKKSQNSALINLAGNNFNYIIFEHQPNSLQPGDIFSLTASRRLLNFSFLKIRSENRLPLSLDPANREISPLPSGAAFAARAVVSFWRWSVDGLEGLFFHFHFGLCSMNRSWQFLCIFCGVVLSVVDLTTLVCTWRLPKLRMKMWISVTPLIDPVI